MEEIKDKEQIKEERMEAVGHRVGSFFAWTVGLCLSALAAATTVKVIIWMLF